MPTALSSKIRLALHAIKDAHGTIFRVEEIEMPIGLSDIRQTQIRDHDSLHGGIDPEGYGIIPNKFHLADSQRSVLVGKIAGRVRMFAKTANEIHDLASLNSSLWHGIQKIHMHVNMVSSHVGQLSAVELLFKVFR